MAFAGLWAQADEHDDTGFTATYCAEHAERPADRQSNFGRVLCANAEEIESNDADIAANKAMGDANREMIESNDMDIAANMAMGAANRGMIESNDMDIAANMAMLARHGQMLTDHAGKIDANAKAIDMLDERVGQVAAMAAALSAVPNAPSAGEKFFIGVGMGNHSGESSLAVGLSGRVGPKQNILVNAGVANSSGETTVRAGIGWAF